MLKLTAVACIPENWSYQETPSWGKYTSVNNCLIKALQVETFAVDGTEVRRLESVIINKLVGMKIQYYLPYMVQTWSSIAIYISAFAVEHPGWLTSSCVVWNVYSVAYLVLSGHFKGSCFCFGLTQAVTTCCHKPKKSIAPSAKWKHVFAMTMQSA